MSSDTTTSEPSLEELVGSSLLVEVGKTKPTKSVVAGKKFVLLYFSASWCPPCKAFTPILKEFYNANSKSIEIVFVSSDRKPDEFKAYFSQMPWTAIESPEIRQKLAQTMGITGIPALFVMETATGKLVTSDGRNDVMRSKDTALAKWNSTEPTSIADGVKSEQGSILKQMLMAVLKNPIYIFGMLYIVKWIMRKVSGATEEVTPSIKVEEAPISDDEF